MSSRILLPRARCVFAALAAFIAPVLAPQSAAAAEAVTVYTSREPAFVEPLLRVFEELTQVKLTLVYVKDGLIERVVTEGDRSAADVILANEFGQLIDAKAKGITQAVSLPVLAERIPASFRDPADHWFGLSQRVRVVLAAKERIKQQAFTYEDLADPKWKGRICTRSLQHPYNVGLVASLIAHKGEAWTETWLRGLKSNLAIKPAGGDRDQIANVHAGKCDIALANSYYLGTMQAEQSKPEQKAQAASVQVIMPNAADRGSHVSLSGMAMAKHAPNPDNARLLMDFLVSEPAQVIYALDNHEYPVRDDAAPSPAVASWGKLKPDFIPLAIVASHSKKAGALIDKVGVDVGPGQ